MLAEIHLQFKVGSEEEDRTEQIEVNSITELSNLAYKRQHETGAENVNFELVAD